MSLNERLQLQERLLEIARNLSASLELEPFLQSIIAVASELTSSEVASILEYDDSSGQLRFAAVPWFHREALQSIQVPLDGSAAGWAYTQAQPLVIQDVTADSRHFKAADQACGFETRSLLAVPLIFKGQPIGVLEAVNKTGNAHYTEEDVTILETLASQATSALQNAQLQRQMQATYSELAQLDRMKNEFIAIASHELRTPLGLILGHATFLREVVGEEHRDQLDTIIRNATRLKEIIESLANVEHAQADAAQRVFIS